MTDHTAPIYIMSSERSGSNLLRTLLSNHSRIAAPLAPQLLPLFHCRSAYYEPLDLKANAICLTEDMLALVNHPYYNWELAKDVYAMYEKYRPQEFLDFFTLLYREKQKMHQKHRFVCKENRLFEFAPLLLAYNPQSRVIYLYRDPRDVVASFSHLPFGPKTAYAAACLWHSEQEKCRLLVQTFRLPVFTVQYERLLSETPKVMTDLLAFLDESPEENCFQVDVQKNVAVVSNPAWQNLSKPILTSNSGKYRIELSLQTIRMIEGVNREHMLRLGYPFDTEADWKPHHLYRYLDYLKAITGADKKGPRQVDPLLANRNAWLDRITRQRRAEWLAHQNTNLEAAQ
ncbi:MAG: sulfotransferase [Anaerolineales bacterium]|nr:sulfotransferase [Anaerolineales bacterium]